MRKRYVLGSLQMGSENVKMTDRWTEQSETEQQISLLDSGELLLYASNDKTIVKEARSEGKRRFYNEKLGTFFAVQNPSDEHLSILVKRSGQFACSNPKRRWRFFESWIPYQF